MDAQSDLILGVFANWGLPELEAYMESSVRCGFRGRKILLVWNISAQVRSALLGYKFELIDIAPAHGCHNFFEYRDRLAYEFLRDHGSEFRFVFWMDIRDLVFQTDPSVWMEKNLGTNQIVAGSECIRIKNETINDNWLRAIAPTPTYDRIREHEVLNGGTLAGTSSAMTSLFEKIYAVARGTSEIAEQAAVNIILRDDAEFQNATLIPRMSEGFAVVGFGFGNKPSAEWTDECPEIRAGVLYPHGKQEPFCIVHQYDRHRDWKHAVSAIYKKNPPARRKYAADGLTQDWWG